MTLRRLLVLAAAAAMIVAAIVAWRALAPGGRLGPRSADDAADAAFMRQHYTRHEYRKGSVTTARQAAPSFEGRIGKPDRVTCPLPPAPALA
jgi:hypothetical protein